MFKKLLLFLLTASAGALPAASEPVPATPEIPLATQVTVPDQSSPQTAIEDFLYAFLLQDAEVMWQLLPPEQQQKMQAGQRSSEQAIGQIFQDMLNDKHVKSARQLGVFLNTPQQTAELIALLSAAPGVCLYLQDKYFLNTRLACQILYEKLTALPPLQVPNQSSPQAAAGALIHAMAIQDHLTIWLLASPDARKEAIRRCGSSKLALAELQQRLQAKKDSPKMREIQRADKDRLMRRLAIRYIVSNSRAMVKVNGKYYINYLAFL